MTRSFLDVGMRAIRSPYGAHWAWLALPLVASAASRGMWAPDEPRYAEVAREIVERGDFLVLHLCGEVYPDKPPLLYWIAALAGALSGWSELAMRLVSVASACATAWLCGVLARRWWGRGEARLAPALFLGTAMVSDIGGRLQIDPLLAFLCTWSIVEIDAAGREPARAGVHVLRAGLACGLGALTKGPVAFLHVGLVALAWRWLERGRARPPRGVGAGTIAGALVLAVVPVAAWALLASWREPELARQLFFGQHVGRAVEGTQHAGPPWKHLVRMPLFLLPWTVPIVLGLVSAAASMRARARGGLPDLGAVRAALWLVPLLVVFSILPTKRDLYLLPLYPAAALLGARWIAEASRTKRLPPWAGAVGPVVLASAGVLLAALPLLARARSDLLGGIDPGALAWRTPLVALALLVGALASVRDLRARDALAWARTVAVTWALGATAFAALVYPLVDPLKSARDLGEWLAARPEDPERIPCLGVQPEGYRFYGRVPTVPGTDLGEALEREGGDFLALVREQEHRALSPGLLRRTRVLHRTRVGSRDVLVLGAARSRELDAEARAAER